MLKCVLLASSQVAASSNRYGAVIENEVEETRWIVHVIPYKYRGECCIYGGILELTHSRMNELNEVPNVYTHRHSWFDFSILRSAVLGTGKSIGRWKPTSSADFSFCWHISIELVVVSEVCLTRVLWSWWWFPAYVLFLRYTLLLVYFLFYSRCLISKKWPAMLCLMRKTSWSLTIRL